MMRFLVLILCGFGAFSIFWFCRYTLKDTVSYNMNIYAALYANMNGTEGSYSAERDAAELSRICDSFLKSLFSPDIDLFVKTDAGDTVYASRPGIPFPDDRALRPEQKELLYQKIKGRYLYITSLVDYHGTRYVLVYSADISSVYQRITRYVLALLVFLAFAGAVAARIIQSFSKTISRPLQDLAEEAERWEEDRDRELEPCPTDITEINTLFTCFATMRREISDKMGELTRQNQEKQQFIDSLTHELRTPLTSIIGYSSLMENMPFDEKKAKFAFHTIHENGVRIEELTESLIRLISLRTEKEDVKTFSLRDLLEEIKNRFSPRLSEKKAILTITGDDLCLTTDRGLMDILVSNFVDNAVKAVTESPVREITLGLQGERLCVRDTGKGIPAEDLDKIFQPFFMVDRSRKRSDRGFGLGLSINDMIRRKLELTIRVESTPGDGTVITIGLAAVLAERMSEGPVSS